MGDRRLRDARFGFLRHGTGTQDQGSGCVCLSYSQSAVLEGNLREDDLIAETFVRYLKSEDDSWPLLFPMVKSVVKAMDVLQAFGKKEWSAPINKFIVAGASERGWTTWLTAAVDKRIGAIAPVVIDVLNMREQMPRQLQAFGAYSSRLAAYSSRGLLPIPKTQAGHRLLNMVDPWAYRDRLTMPKLIINGTNDFYWATDALNLYWDGIPNDKWARYIPNAGHNLRRQDRPQPEQLNDLITSLAAFSRHQIKRRANAKLALETRHRKRQTAPDHRCHAGAHRRRDFGSPRRQRRISAQPNGTRRK